MYIFGNDIKYTSNEMLLPMLSEINDDGLLYFVMKDNKPLYSEMDENENSICLAINEDTPMFLVREDDDKTYLDLETSNSTSKEMKENIKGLREAWQKT